MLSSRIVEDGYEGKTIKIHESEQLEQEAELALTMLEKWGMVAAGMDGEDSAGRQKMRLLTPEELVDRAFTAARLAMQRARETGLVHQIPDLPQ